jgi:cold shock CspA family protein
MRSIIAEKVEVKIYRGVGSMGYTFFTSDVYGDVYISLEKLETNGFKASDLIVGSSALIDIMAEGANMWTAKVHKINDRTGRRARKIKKTRTKEQALMPGVKAIGTVKSLKESYGFIGLTGRADLFFAFKRVEIGLLRYLEKGVEVKFTVEKCERGVMARITDIVWKDSQILVRHGTHGVKGELIAEPE